MNIVIAQDGSVKMIASEEGRFLIDQGVEVRKTRASHVVPLDPVLRVAFRVIRWATGEAGRVSDWTRSWKVLWLVDLSPSGGPVGQIFRDRSAAIRYEIRWLTDNKF